jgi:hypothetical protein
VPAADSVLCRIHERAPSTKAEYFEECRTFLQDVFDAGRRADRDVLLALLVMAFEDDAIRKEFLAIVAGEVGDARRATSASAPRPHPLEQKSDRRTDREGAHQTQTPHPQAVDEDDVELVFEDVTEEIE